MELDEKGLIGSLFLNAKHIQRYIDCCWNKNEENRWLNKNFAIAKNFVMIMGKYAISMHKI